MNRLIKRAPETVTIDGVAYRINTDFRDCLQIMQASADDELLPFEKCDILIDIFYKEVPPNLEKAVEKALWFFRCGKETDGKTEEGLCDFEKDSSFIYNAILKKGIDLDKVEGMHWWTFMSHFAEIGDSMFSRIVYLRSQKKKGKITKEERKECEHIGWDIINMTDGSNDDEIWAYLQGED